MPRRGGRRKKARTQAEVDERLAAPTKKKKGGVAVPPPQARKAAEESGGEAVPRSMIVRRGATTRPVAELLQDLRKVMAPNTAEKLKEKAKNTLKDFVHAAQPLGVTHLLMLAQKAAQLNLRCARLPGGPTLAWKVDGFVVAKDVRAEQRRPFDSSAAFGVAPLLVLNNFGGDGAAPHVKVARITLEAMFPKIDVSTVRLADVRRVVLVDRDPSTDVCELRHYAIRARAAGISKPVKRVVEARGKTPDLGKLADISEYVRGLARAADDGASDSEAEDAAARVVLPGKFAGRGNVANRESAVSLAELGPRLTMRLYKVQRGVCDGDVLYHAFASPEAGGGAAAEAGDDAGDDADDDDADDADADAREETGPESTKRGVVSFEDDEPGAKRRAKKQRKRK